MLQIPVAKVAVLAATFAFDRPYTYKIPQPLTETLRPGCRVMVPFSRGNRPCEGMVLALDQAQDDPKLKPITRQLDPVPILSPELIRLAIWMHDRFFCTIYDALHAILPAGVWYRVSTVYCAAPELDTDAALALCGRSKQRRLALETVLAHGGRCPLETLQTAFGDKDPAST
ncbi:MAG: primosomal protein N', partial [Oscillospiraceae bacterium]